MILILRFYGKNTKFCGGLISSNKVMTLQSLESGVSDHGVHHGVLHGVNSPQLTPIKIPKTLPFIQRSPLDKKHHVSPRSPLFLVQKFLFLNLLTSFIKPFKTSDFSKHDSHVLTR